MWSLSVGWVGDFALIPLIFSVLLIRQAGRHQAAGVEWRGEAEETRAALELGIVGWEIQGDIPLKRKKMYSW